MARQRNRKRDPSSIVVTSGGEVVSAYRDGENVTDERKALEEHTKDAISRFLNRDKKELEFYVLYAGDGWNVDRGYSGRSVIYIFLQYAGRYY